MSTSLGVQRKYLQRDQVLRSDASKPSLMEVATVSLLSLGEYIISEGVIMRCGRGGSASGAAISGGKIDDKMIITEKKMILCVQTLFIQRNTKVIH